MAFRVTDCSTTASIAITLKVSLLSFEHNYRYINHSFKRLEPPIPLLTLTHPQRRRRLTFGNFTEICVNCLPNERPTGFSVLQIIWYEVFDLLTQSLTLLIWFFYQSICIKLKTGRTKRLKCNKLRAQEFASTAESGLC